jgi:glutamyl-tRNA synthetase
VIALRFAPRAGARLDLSGAREAIINWLFARKEEGRFLLRLDDAEPGGASGIESDLAWLGLGWDLFARQSERLAFYAGAAERLKAAGRLVASAGDPPDWHFRLERRPVTWDDLVQGPTAFDLGALGDPVAIRADGTPLPWFAAAIDDVMHEISHVVLAADRLAETAVAIAVHRALERDPPRFGHLALLVVDTSEAMTVAALRQAGLEPMAVDAVLAGLGRAGQMAAALRLQDLVAGFDIAALGGPPVQVDRAALLAANARLLQQMPFERVAHRLPKGAAAPFWDAVRPALSHFAEVEGWWRVCQGPIAPERASGDVAFLERAAELLPPERLDAGSWEKWQGRLRALTGRKGETLTAPLRRALTGREDGPDLAHLLPLIGRSRAAARLTGETA